MRHRDENEPFWTGPQELAMQRMLLNFLLTGMIIMGAAAPGFAVEAKSNTYFDLGVFAFEQGNYREALDYLTQALKSDPKDVAIYHYLGTTNLKLGRTLEAAHYLEVVEKMDPDWVGLPYNVALLYMKQEKYQEALDKLFKIIENDPTNVLALYNAGISLYELKRWDAAIDYLSRASELSPGIKANAEYYVGICHYRTGHPDNAFESFSFVKRTTPNDALRVNAEKWLATIEREKLAGKRYRLFAKAGFQYDDNVVLEPLDEEVFSDESDLSFVGYFSGRYDLLSRAGLKAGAGYSHYQTVHQDLSDYDVTGSIGRFYVEYGFFPLSLGFSWLPSYYWIDSDSYLMRHEFSPEASWQINNRTLATVSYSYMVNNYFLDGGRDGHANTADLDVLHVLRHGYLTWGLGVEVNSAKRDDEEYNEFEARIGGAWPLVEKFRLAVAGIYNEKDYDAPDEIIGTTREDNRYYVTLSVSRPVFYDWLSLSLDYEYTRNNSNINLFEYQRNAVALSVAASL